MATKRSNKEIREEVEREDDTKDVNIKLGIAVAVIAGISCAAAILASLSVGFLEHFRQDVSAYWSACIPFTFPIMTGLAVAYRKQLANVGMHFAMLFFTTLTGGAGFASSIQLVYVERHDCTQVSFDRGPCDKEVLVTIYIIAGGIACGFALLGILVTILTCSSSQKRRAQRELERHIREEAEVDKKGRQVKHIKQGTVHQPTITPVAAAPETNGNVANGVAPDATTHL